jgi:hypothetical protein
VCCCWHEWSGGPSGWLNASSLWQGPARAAGQGCSSDSSDAGTKASSRCQNQGAQIQTVTLVDGLPVYHSRLIFPELSEGKKHSIALLFFSKELSF